MKTNWLAACVLFTACGVQQLDETESVGVSKAEINGDNGFSANGFSANGFSANGFSANGFSANGFSANGLRTVLSGGAVIAEGAGNAAFNTWFDSTPTAAEWMKYFVRCALPAGEQVTFRTYAWPGALGVAPNWKYGNPTEADQQRVTACLMAHVNSAGQVVQISLQSDTLAYDSAAEGSFQILEGKFWGNVFGPNPTAYTCNYNKTYYARCTGYPNLPYTQQMCSNAGLAGAWGRTCATSYGCSGFTSMGSCTSVCSGGNCVTNGVTYAGSIVIREKTPSSSDVCSAYYY